MLENVHVISFDAENFFFLPDRSYYTQSKKETSPELNFAITRKRKAAPDHVPLCRINYAFEKPALESRSDPRPTMKNLRYTGDDEVLNIHPQKTNYEIGKNTLAAFLTSVTAYSAIYIAGHGGTHDRHLEQKVTYVKKNGQRDTVIISITVECIAEILHLYIRTQHRHHLKIHLLMCNGQAFADGLSGSLFIYGFTNTCVVYYDDPIAIIGFNFFEKENLLDFISRKHWYRLLHWTVENSKLKDKYCYHIKNNECKWRTYAAFKEENWNEYNKEEEREPYLLSNRYGISNKNIIAEEISRDNHARLFQLMLFHNCLLKMVTKYIKYNSNQPSSRMHGTSGRARAYRFIEKINLKIYPLYSQQNENDYTDKKNSNIRDWRIEKKAKTFLLDLDLASIEIGLILEIIDFSAGVGYEYYSGAINVEDHSCLTYIFWAVFFFFQKRDKAALSSPVFIDFINRITEGRYLKYSSVDEETFPLVQNLFASETNINPLHRKINEEILDYTRDKAICKNNREKLKLRVKNLKSYFEKYDSQKDKIITYREYLDSTQNTLLNRCEKYDQATQQMVKVSFQFAKTLILFSQKCRELYEIQSDKKKKSFFSSSNQREIEMVDLFSCEIKNRVNIFLISTKPLEVNSEDINKKNLPDTNYYDRSWSSLTSTLVEAIIRELFLLFKKEGKYFYFDKISDEKNSLTTYLLHALDAFFKAEPPLTLLAGQYLQALLSLLTDKKGLGKNNPKSLHKYLFNQWRDCEQTTEAMRKKFEKTNFEEFCAKIIPPTPALL